MTTIALSEEVNPDKQETPGEQLARTRKEKGYSLEYVASKLYLRVKIIELLEGGNYEQMPEPVFIKGYLRAYAKLLEIPPEPLLDTFNRLFDSERKPEKALWQGRRESHKGEKLVHWVTGIIALTVIIAVSIFWQKSKDSQPVFAPKTALLDKKTTDLQLTDLSKMRSVRPSSNLLSASMETKGG